MRYSFIIITLLMLLVVSCEEKQDTRSTSEKTEKKTLIIAEGDPVEFNDMIALMFNRTEKLLEGLNKLDQDNAAENVITEEAVLSYDLIAKDLALLASTNAVGEGGNDYKFSAELYLKAAQDITNIYKDFAQSLSIPDEDWTEEEYQNWMGLAEPFFQDYIDALDNIVMGQDNYSNLQSIDILIVNPNAAEIENDNEDVIEL